MSTTASRLMPKTALITQIAQLEMQDKQTAKARQQLATRLMAHIEDHTAEIRASEELLARVAPRPAQQVALPDAPVLELTQGPTRELTLIERLIRDWRVWVMFLSTCVITLGASGRI
jgi:hypothetical protein